MEGVLFIYIKIKKIIFVICVTILMLIPTCIGVLAGIPTNLHTYDGKQVPDLPDEISGKHFVLFNSNGTLVLMYWYAEPSLALRHTQGVIEKYNNTGNSVLTCRFGGTYVTMQYQNGDWVSKGTNIYSGIYTFTPPNLRIEYCSFDIVHYDDSSFIFYEGSRLIYKAGDEPTEPSDPEPSDPEPSDPEPIDPEPIDPEPSDPEPIDPEPSDPEPSDPDPTEPVPTEPTVPLPTLPDNSVDTTTFLSSFGRFIKEFLGLIVEWKVALVCFGVIVSIGAIGLIMYIAKRRF